MGSSCSKNGLTVMHPLMVTRLPLCFSQRSLVESAWRNLDTFHDQKNSFPSTKRYFQDKARRTEIIQKREIGFHDNKNLSSLLRWSTTVTSNTNYSNQIQNQ